jgi:hypothetical protein
MLTKPKTDGPGKTVRFKKRQQKRNPRKLIEATAKDWARWLAGAEAEGVNFNEFTRRALEARFREFVK